MPNVTFSVIIITFYVILLMYVIYLCINCDLVSHHFNLLFMWSSFFSLSHNYALPKLGFCFLMWQK